MIQAHRISSVLFLACCISTSALFSCKPEPKAIILRKPTTKATADLIVRKEVRTVAFGSCAHAEQPMPVSMSQFVKNQMFLCGSGTMYTEIQRTFRP